MSLKSNDSFALGCQTIVICFEIPALVSIFICLVIRIMVNLMMNAILADQNERMILEDPLRRFNPAQQNIILHAVFQPAIGKELLGKKVGDHVKIEVPNGDIVELEVQKIFKEE